jgi:peptidoglycan/LPS O-acetylase OafA/YrhL
VTELRRIPELDGVRGCAVGLVLIFHLVVGPIEAPPATFWSYMQAAGRLTWSGVDLFFVLSGFLIGGILIDSRDSPNYFRAFYARRFFRIVPLYMVILGIALIAKRGTIDEHIPTFSYFIFLQNFWMARFNTLGWLLAATWSLAVEEQFYLTLPSVVRFVDRLHLICILAAAIFAAPCLRILCFLLWPQHEVVTYAITPCRGDTLLLGVLGAIAMRDMRGRRWIENNGLILLVLLLVSGVGVALLTFVPPHGFIMVSVGYPLLAGFYLLLILYVISQPQSWLGHAMRLTALRWLGSLAYGVYLVHQMVAIFVFRLIWHSTALHLHSVANVGAMTLALLLTLAVCQLSWAYFEKPLLHLGHRFRYDEKRGNSQ